jgi:outer membrane lipoprotein SlyB
MQSLCKTPARIAHSRALSLIVAGFSAVLIGGCATSPVSKVGASTQVEYYPTCYEPVQYLRDSNADVTKSVAGGAAIGAVGGALVGALTGSGEHRARNAAIGAAGGALAGGAVGYYTEKQKQIADDKQRIGAYGLDINRSAADIDRSSAYAKASQSCYQTQFASLISARKANTLDDSEGRKRLAEIVAGLKESNDLIVAVNGRASEDLNNYAQAYEKDLQAVGVQRADVVTVATVSPAPVVNPSVRKKAPAKKKRPNVPKEAVATEKTLQDAAAKQAASQQVAAAGQSQVNSMCKNPDLGDWAPVPCPNV